MYICLLIKQIFTTTYKKKKIIIDMTSVNKNKAKQKIT